MSSSSSSSSSRAPSLLSLIAFLAFLTALRSVLVSPNAPTPTTEFLDAFVTRSSSPNTLIDKEKDRHSQGNINPITEKGHQQSKIVTTNDYSEATPAPFTQEKDSSAIKSEEPRIVEHDNPQELTKELLPLPIKIVNTTATATATATLKFCKACQEQQTACLDQMKIVNLFDPTEIRRAMCKVAEQSSTCHVCHPDKYGSNCTASLLQPLGFDKLAPPISYSKTYVTLPSIPTNRRIIPLDAMTPYPESATTIPIRGPLAVYNPSILPIPPTLKISLQGLYASEPTYLASFRVTDVGACNILPHFDWRKYGVNLVALVILDQTLEVLDDVLLDINKEVPHLSSNVFEDYRLFDIQGVVYLSHMSLLLPIEVTSKKSLPVESRLIPSINDNTNLQVFIPAGKAPTIAKMKGSMKGKNFQFFDDADGNTTYVEFWPSPHLVGTLDDGMAVVGSNDNQTAFYPPRDSFGAPKFSSTNDRGSACCVKLEKQYLPEAWQGKHDFLQLGISHVRSKKDKRKIYMSRLYAFVPEFPFALVARSGLFCFGSGDAMPQPFSNVTLAQKMRLRRVEYDCPNFHYISGMTTTITKDSVLVAYGVVDCVSRIVEIRKEELARALFTNLNTVQRVV